MEVAARGLHSNACAIVTKPLSVLLIDDNPARAEIVEAGLASAGYVLLVLSGQGQGQRNNRQSEFHFINFTSERLEDRMWWCPT